MVAAHPIAAVDLGSNSFRLEIAALERGQLQRLQYDKETVRQGYELDAQRYLSQDAMHRGWSCLARFGERLAGFKPEQVRAVATQTLREARNREEFLVVAQHLLGFPIEVISGQDEAQLIYHGVAHFLAPSHERRLVIDVGGRSTETVIGQGDTAHAVASFAVGSVVWSLRYFPDGVLSAQNFERAEAAAQAVLNSALRTHAPGQWDTVYGSSGAIDALASALWFAGRAPAQDTITREGLDWLLNQLIEARHVGAIRLGGITDERKPVVGGGLAVLRAVFELLDIQTLQHAQGALRHGALLSLMDRENDRVLTPMQQSA